MSSDFPSNPFRNTSWDDEPEAEETYNLPLTPPIVGLHVEHMKQLDILVSCGFKNICYPIIVKTPLPQPTVYEGKIFFWDLKNVYSL